MKEKIKNYWWLIIVIIIIGGAFYWYEWRPTQIRKECFNIAVSIGGVDFDKNYYFCLLDHGLEETPIGENNQLEKNQKSLDFDLNLSLLSYTLPEYTKICLPNLRYDCSSNACIQNKPSVFILYDENSNTVYRCDNNPCDGYEVYKNISGLYTNLTSQNPTGAIWKISVDNQYVETVSLGLDFIIYRGQCQEKK